jgi:hypothetical protein
MCSSEVGACEADTTCNGVFTTEGSCICMANGDMTAEDACITTADMNALAKTLDDCIESNCASDCL